MRGFNALRAWSPLPPAYHYLFVLFILTFGSQIVLLPLLWPVARTQFQMRRLAPEIETIRQIYASDFLLQQQHIQALYARHNVRFGHGCWVFLADLVFALWALASLHAYAPQMALDGSKFLWITDVTRFDGGSVLLLIGCWLLKGYVVGIRLRTALFPSRQGCGASAGGTVLIAAAWLWSWPAYMFLFASLLMVVGTLMVKLLTGVVWLRPGNR